MLFFKVCIQLTIKSGILGIMEVILIIYFALSYNSGTHSYSTAIAAMAVEFMISKPLKRTNNFSWFSKFAPRDDDKFSNQQNIQNRAHSRRHILSS